MRAKVNGALYPVLRGLGSLWLGAVLLVLLLVGMAYATVFEKMRGTDQALAFFYESWWFTALMVLLAINVGMAAVVRFPFSRRQIGFVVTHASILVVLAGGLVSQQFGVEGYLQMHEGDTLQYMGVKDDDMLFFIRRSDDAETTADLSDLPSSGLCSVKGPVVPPVPLDEGQVEVAQYLPDSEETAEVVNDSPRPRLAVEVSFSDPDAVGEASAWIFADQTSRVGLVPVLFRAVDEDELRGLLAEPKEKPEKPAESVGLVRVEHEGATFELPVEECTEKPVPLGETGYTVRVLRYMPHARVGRDNQLENASDEPVNPMIEVELVGPEGTMKVPAFAKFPELRSIHGMAAAAGLKVTFVASGDAAPSAPISVLGGPGGKLYARFVPEGQPAVTKELTIGEPCTSPWAGCRLTVLRRFDRARVESTVVAREPIRETRYPAVLLKLPAQSTPESLWLRRGKIRPIMVGNAIYDVVYGNRRVALGFSVTLTDFEVGYYPGTSDERSYEAVIRILDPVAGRKLTRVISMNHPTTFGGYTFYQASFGREGERMYTVLRASWDPGEPIVFAGYVGLMAGMLLVLGRRIADHRRSAARRRDDHGAQGELAEAQLL